MFLSRSQNDCYLKCELVIGNTITQMFVAFELYYIFKKCSWGIEECFLSCGPVSKEEKTREYSKAVTIFLRPNCEFFEHITVGWPF